MFSYHHLRTDGFARTYSYSWTNTVDPITDPNTNYNIPGSAGLDSSVYKTSVYLSGSHFVSEICEEVGLIGGGRAIGTNRTSYPYGTSVSNTVPGTTTRARSSTTINALAVPSTVLVSDNTSGTFTKEADGISSCTRSTTYTHSSTSSTLFSTVYFSNSLTTLSASTSAVGTISAPSTASLTMVTTTAHVFGQFFSERRWFAGKENPPPLRRAALPLAIPVSSITHYLTQATGDVTLNSSLMITSAFSSTTSSENIFAGDSAGGGETIRTTFTSSAKGYCLTYFTQSEINLIISARRSVFSEIIFNYDTGFSQAGSALAFSPDPEGIGGRLAPFALNASYPSIYTTIRRGQTVNGSSASLAWIYSQSSWSLRASLKNTSTSTTLWISVNLTGQPSSGSSSAISPVGISTALLGPLYPFSISGGNAVHFSLANDRKDSVSAFYGYSNTGMTTGTSTQFSSSAPLSASTSFLSGQTDSTFKRFYAGLRAASFSTQSTNLPPLNVNENFNPSLLETPAILNGEKWNEAGRQDAVSVIV